MKQNIDTLFRMTKNYRISKATGLAQTTLGRYTSGSSDIGNMKLDHAITLNEYYNKIKGEIKMKNIITTLQNNWKVDGEDGKYATVYSNKEELLDEIDQEIFEEKYLNYNIPVKVIDELQFPIITFDEEGSDSGVLFEADATREEIMSEANERFTALDDDSSVWEYDTYNVFEEMDVLRFEDKNGDVLGYVAYDDKENMVNELNNGVDPFDEGWEDGVGNEINIDGWGEGN